MLSKRGLNYEIVGSQSEKKLVFLHGLMGSLNNWRSIARDFREEFEILLLDQRGHGRSFHPAGGYTPEDYAQDLSELLGELGWETVHLVGHSMGGRNAFVFAHLFKERVFGLVIEDISIKPRGESVDALREMILKIPAPFSSRKEAQIYFSSDFKKNLRYPEKAEALSQFLFSNLVEDSKYDKKLRWRFSLQGVLESLEVGRNRDFALEWSGLSCPILLVRGEISSDLSQSDYLEMLGMNETSTGVVIPLAGHWVHFDAPSEFVGALQNFFQSLTSSARVV